MKSMIMLLTLTFYNTATLAAQADDQNTYQQQLKHRHQNAISNVQPLSVPAFDEEPHYIKLIAPIENERDLKTFRAGLTIRGYSKMIT
jgi:hypothetical protein